MSSFAGTDKAKGNKQTTIGSFDNSTMTPTKDQKTSPVEQSLKLNKVSPTEAPSDVPVNDPINGTYNDSTGGKFYHHNVFNIAVFIINSHHTEYVFIAPVADIHKNPIANSPNPILNFKFKAPLLFSNNKDNCRSTNNDSNSIDSPLAIDHLRPNNNPTTTNFNTVNTNAHDSRAYNAASTIMSLKNKQNNKQSEYILVF